VRRLALVFLALAGSVRSAVPAPEAHFGHKIGADRTVLDWDRVVSYFRALERESDRIRIDELGKSTGGRPFIAATIAAPPTLRRLGRYTSIQKQLADPRATREAEAERLIEQGKTIVLITCSIHATEIASTHTAVEFAYRLLTGDTPKIRAILDNTIFLLVPSLNPDGLDLVTRWYRKTLGTPYEGTSPPELYHKYVGHDNNRDWYMFTQVETRLAVERLHNVWHPQIVYDVHQQGPFASRMFVPPWIDPIEPNIDPIIVQQCNVVGAGIASDLTAAGRTGVVINALYDFWTPARHYQAYHGGLRILSESASVRIATPITVRPGQIGERAAGYNPRERSWNYLEPWLGGEWRLRDIIDDQLIAMESVLFQAAVRREDMLRNFYRVHQRAVARTSPWAFAVPALQHDPGAASKLLETLAFGLVEVDQAGAGFEAGGRRYPPGSYIIRMQQPYSSYAKTLLERQSYPDLRVYPGGPPRPPYDVTAHTLPLLMGVTADALDDPVRVPFKRVRDFHFPRRGLAASDTETWRAINQSWRSGAVVWRDPRTGDFYLSPAPDTVPVARPRIGLYRSWIPNMDEGWTRWLLEQFGFDYTSLPNADILAGDLRRRFDVIVFADQPASEIASGFAQGRMPDEYTGGLAGRGAEELKEFADQGGTLIFLNRSTEFAARHLGIALKNCVEDLPAREFYAPGSLLRALVDTSNDLSRGLPHEIAVWAERGPVWEVPDTGRVLARYPDSGVLASGWLLGESRLAGKAAAVDYPMGAGRAILFGIRPQYRGQSYSTFKFLFNSLLAAGRPAA
jgi:hypothetical protein